jgi:hypothetical protein
MRTFDHVARLHRADARRRPGGHDVAGHQRQDAGDPRRLATATTTYREMGMTYWLEKAEAEMTELGR